MVAKRSNRTIRRLLAAPIGLGLVTIGAVASANPGSVQNPNFNPHPEAVVIDLSPDAPAHLRPRVQSQPTGGVPFSDLDQYRRDVEPSVDEVGEDALPQGLAQVGTMVVPEPMLSGAQMVGDVDEAQLTVGELPTLPGFIDDVCAFPDEVPPGIYDYDYRPGMELPRRHTVYLNFVGATLATGAENAAENLSNIARSGHPFPVYAGGEMSAIAVAQAVAADLEQWGIDVVYLERPPKVLPYSMAMIGGHWSDTTAGPSGGVAPLDCEDFGQRNVCYAFQNNGAITGQANVTSQEIGHTMGLEHTDAPDSVMALGYSQTQGGDLGFNNGCADSISVAGQGTGCNGVNRCHCGNPDQQHDRNTLSAIFVQAGADVTPPTIDILEPADGSVFAPDESFLVTFDPWDDVGGYGWKMIVEDEAGEVLVDQVDYDRALEFILTGLPVGTYTITALVMDHGGNETTDSITVTIAGEDAGTGGSGGSDGSDGGLDGTAGGSDGSGTAGGTGIEGETDAETAGQATDDGGCGCTTDTPRGGVLGWLALMLLGLRRRRD